MKGIVLAGVSCTSLYPIAQHISKEYYSSKKALRRLSSGIWTMRSGWIMSPVGSMRSITIICIRTDKPQSV